MINIIIIEDQIDQLEDMRDNLRKLALEFNQLPEYFDNPIKIEPICTRKLDISTTQNEFKEYINTFLSSLNIDVLIIDYDLQWSENGEISFDGDQVIKAIDDLNEHSPYIILASEKFNQKEYPNALLELVNLSELATKQVNKSTFTSEWVKNGPNYSRAKEVIKYAVSYASKKKLNFDCFDFPSTEIYAKGRDHIPFFRQAENTISKVTLDSDQIMAILLGHNYTYSIITRENEKIQLRCVHFIGNLGQRELSEKYDFLTIDTKILLNTKYMESRNRQFSFKLEIVPASKASELISLINSHVDKISEQKSELVLGEYFNPFYKVFLKFNGVIEPD